MLIKEDQIKPNTAYRFEGTYNKEKFLDNLTMLYTANNDIPNETQKFIRFLKQGEIVLVLDKEELYNNSRRFYKVITLKGELGWLASTHYCLMFEEITL